MSSIKHSRDANIEPSNSLARQKIRDNVPPDSLRKHGKSPGSSKTDSINQLSLKTRRPKNNSQVPKQQSGQSLSLGHRRSRASASMEPYEYGNPDRDSRSGSRSREIDLPDSSVRYTPKTRRVSRAMKGQPVHECTRCNPPRVFTRAEHLRRHALSHDVPSYRCTFEDCEKKFHRSDLLARHVDNHESRGEQPYRVSKNQDRFSTSSAKSQSPQLPEDAEDALNTSETNHTSMGQHASQPNYAGSDSAKTVVSRDEMIIDGGGGGDTFSNLSTGPSTTRTGHLIQLSFKQGTTINTRTSTDLTDFAPDGGGTGMNTAHMDSVQNHNQSAFVNTYQNAPRGNRHPSLTLHVPDPSPPNLIHTSSSPWSPTDSSRSTPSDLSRPRVTWIVDRPTSTPVDDAWRGHPMFTSPQSSNGNLRSPGSEELEIGLDRVDSPPYLPHVLSPPLLSYHTGGMPHSEETPHDALVHEESISRMIKSEHEAYAGIPRSCRLPFLANETRPDTLVHVEDSSIPQSSLISFLDEGKLKDYIVSYQMHVNPVFPVLHPETYNRRCFSAVLKNAVAALGSQFRNDPEDGKHGIQLNAVCDRMLNHPNEWSTQTMQCVLLVELFGRFRSPKVIRRPSHRFRELCDKLFDNQSPENVTKGILARLNPQEIHCYVDHLTQSAQDTALTREQCVDDIWRDWVDYETRQRLRSACFIFDAHQARYYGQDRELKDVYTDTTVLPFQCPETLWAAQSGAEWFDRVYELNCSAAQSLRPLYISSEYCKSLPLSGRMLVLASLMVRLPPTETIVTSPLIVESYDKEYAAIKTSFPNSLVSHAHLALYHTPLQDVLAFTGDSWAFGRKITSSTEMVAINHRLNRWLRTLLALRATWHACHVIRIFLSQGSGTGDSFSYMNISDYWAAYTAALICWLFGRASPHRQHHNRSTSIPKAASASSNSSFSNLSSLNSITSRDEFDEVRADALKYTEGMLSIEPAEIGSARMRPATTDMLKAVRWKLGIETSDGEFQCAMLVDACNVLDRILEKIVRMG